MDDFWIGAGFLSSLLIAFFFGWVLAHSTIATECDKLGSFYVGSKVYKCTEVK